MDAIFKFVPVDIGAHGKETMVVFTETPLCIGAWKHEFISCLKIQFCRLVKLHYLTFLLVTKRIAYQPTQRNVQQNIRQEEAILIYRLSRARRVAEINLEFVLQCEGLWTKPLTQK